MLIYLLIFNLNQMADLKIKIDSQKNETNEVNVKLRKENANIFNEYSTLFEKKVF